MSERLAYRVAETDPFVRGLIVALEGVKRRKEREAEERRRRLRDVEGTAA